MLDPEIIKLVKEFSPMIEFLEEADQIHLINEFDQRMSDKVLRYSKGGKEITHEFKIKYLQLKKSKFIDPYIHIIESFNGVKSGKKRELLHGYCTNCGYEFEDRIAESVSKGSRCNVCLSDPYYLNKNYIKLEKLNNQYQ